MTTNEFSFLATQLHKKNIIQNTNPLMVARLLALPQNFSITERLAKQLAEEGKRVLLMRTDPFYKASESSSGGFSHLVAQLLGRPLLQGQVSDYGVVDLFFLMYLQCKTGVLVLKSSQGSLYQAFFCDGYLCSLSTPDQDMVSTLSFFEKSTHPRKQALKLKAQKKQMALVDVLHQEDILGKEELAFYYEHELKHLFQELLQQDLVSFYFKTEMKFSFASVPKLLNHKFVLFQESLKPFNFIVRCIELNIVPQTQNYFLMYRGGKELGDIIEKKDEELKRFFSVLEKHFAHIIIDVSLVTLHSHVMALSSLAKGILCVVDKNNNKYKTLRMMKALRRDHTGVLGFVYSG